MALGIDIYRYQTVTDWNAVKRHGVSFVYVKGTDGFGQAQVKADGQVRGAQSVAIPVGLYHYAQLGNPRQQARVLAAEVRRLGAIGLPPALDLEDPHKPGTAAKAFTLEFLDELHQQGFDQVCLYANTSMLAGIGGPEIDDDPRVMIWAANYGPNDGRRHQFTYRGRVNIHQFTSVGVIPGISGRVDLNESLIAMPAGGDVELTDKIRFWDGFEITVGQALGDTWQLANNITDRPTRPDKPADPAPWITKMFGELAAIRSELATTKADVAELKSRPTADVDEAALAAALDARGIGGVSAAELIQILASTRLVPTQEGI